MWYNRGTENVVSGGACDTPDRIRLDWRHIMDTVPHSAQEGNPYTVYALIDPRDYAVCYIGITNDVYERFFQHLRCDGTNPVKDAWITELRQANVLLIMKTLEVVEDAEKARERETFWIHHYQFLGVRLYNQAIPSIRLPKRVTQPTLIKMRTRRENPNAGRKGDYSKIAETVIYYHVHKCFPDNISIDMRRYYKRMYFTMPYEGEKPYRGFDYEQHLRIYERGQQWITEYESKAAQEGA